MRDALHDAVAQGAMVVGPVALLGACVILGCNEDTPISSPGAAAQAQEVDAGAGNAGAGGAHTGDAGVAHPVVFEAGGAHQPDAWDEDLALSLAEDVNPDPDVLEVHLEAREAQLEIVPGVETHVWTYNGMLPGPLLRAKRGDRLIVHFTNRLPEPTTVHWHGLRVPADMDGTEAVQSPVAPGESFTYDFVLRDAGTYWYHPHRNSATQVGNGLYGAIVVVEPDDPVVADDLVLVFSDISLDDAGQLQPGDVSGWFGDYFGREGGVLLVNGKVGPRLTGRAGAPQRWRIINAARSRYWRLAIPGVPLTRVGGDGGLIERPLPIEELVLAPSERAEILVTPPDPQLGEVPIQWQDANRFNLPVNADPLPLFTFEVVPEDSVASPSLPESLREIPRLDTDSAPVRHIELGERTIGGEAVLTINGDPHAGHGHGMHGHGEEAAGEQVHPTPHVAYVGDTEIWEVENATDHDHPFHLHGFSFQVLEVGGERWPVREWKDSVNVKARQTLRFAVHFDDRPGLWMFHCHILDHAQLGMMAVLDVRSR